MEIAPSHRYTECYCLLISRLILNRGDWYVALYNLNYEGFSVFQYDSMSLTHSGLIHSQQALENHRRTLIHAHCIPLSAVLDVSAITLRCFNGPTETIPKGGRAFLLARSTPWLKEAEAPGQPKPSPSRAAKIHQVLGHHLCKWKDCVPNRQELRLNKAGLAKNPLILMPAMLSCVVTFLRNFSEQEIQTYIYPVRQRLFI